MRRSVTVIGTLATVVGLAFATGSSADRDGGVPELDGPSGVSLIDGDGDGIPDEDDNCVEVPNEDQMDFDLDTVGDVCDNCSEAFNRLQEDCDDDYCGNLCDADYDQSGGSGFSDWGAFVRAFGLPWPQHECMEHTEPADGVIGFGDLGFFTSKFGVPPGPSGTTPGTVACPIW